MIGTRGGKEPFAAGASLMDLRYTSRLWIGWSSVLIATVAIALARKQA